MNKHRIMTMKNPMFKLKEARKSQKAFAQKSFVLAAGVASLVASGEVDVNELIAEGDVVGVPSEGDDLITIGPAGGVVGAGEGNDVIIGDVGNDSIRGGEGADIIDGGAGDDELLGGDGGDLIRDGEGVDDINSGAGVDFIVVVGENSGGTYDIDDVVNPNSLGINLSSVIGVADVNDNAVSDVADGGSIDGGADGAVLFIYGDIDLTPVELDNIILIEMQSTLIIGADQISSLMNDEYPLTAINGDGTSHLIIADSDVPIILDFAGMDMHGIRHLEIGDNVTLILAQEDVDNMTHIEGDGVLQAAVGALDLDGKIIDMQLDVLNADGDNLKSIEIRKVMVGDAYAASPIVGLEAGDSVVYKIVTMTEQTQLKAFGGILTGVEAGVGDGLVSEFEHSDAELVLGTVNSLGAFDEEDIVLTVYDLNQAQYEALEFSTTADDGYIVGYSTVATVTRANGDVELYYGGSILAFGTDSEGTSEGIDELSLNDNYIEFMDASLEADTLVVLADFGGSTIGGVEYGYDFLEVGNEILMVEYTEGGAEIGSKVRFLSGVEYIQFADKTVHVSELELLNYFNVDPDIGPATADHIELFLEAYGDHLEFSADDLSVGGDLLAQPTDGDDAIVINVGNDILVSTGLGEDFVSGSVNDDRIRTGSDDDLVFGGDGHDDIDGGKGNDDLNGDAGNDIILGADGNDQINGGSGFNSLYGGRGEDEITDGDDSSDLYGGAGDDSLFGNGNSDELFGNDGNDELYGGTGNDRLYGGAGADLLDGGAGVDQVNYRRSDAGVNVDLSDAVLETGGHAEGDEIVDVENVVGSSYDDVITGSNLANDLSSSNGDDELYGLDGADELNGGDGDDKLYGGNDDDRLYSSTGLNEFYGGTGNDIIRPGGMADLVSGGADNDTVFYAFSQTGVNVDLVTGNGEGGDAEGDTYESIENIVGSRHDDVIVGNEFDNVFEGYAGNDDIDGGAGRDTIVAVNTDLAFDIDFAAGKIEISFTDDGRANVHILHGIELFDFGALGIHDAEDLWGELSADIQDNLFGSNEAEYLAWMVSAYDYEVV